MSIAKLLLCPDAVDRRWGLGPASAELPVTLLVGWPSSREDGMPPDAAGVLARALCSVARLTFPSSLVERGEAGKWLEQQGSHLLTVAPTTLGALAHAATLRPSGAVTLVSTRRADTAATLFDDPGFPWWLQGQAALLTPPGGDLPPVEYEDFEAWYATPPVIAQIALGLVRPAVDGDAAALRVRSAAFGAAFAASLGSAAREAGLELQVLDEAAFSAALA